MRQFQKFLWSPSAYFPFPQDHRTFHLVPSAQRLCENEEIYHFLSFRAEREIYNKYLIIRE